MSPATGVLDDMALDALLRADGDGALALLADLTRATDRLLRAAARRLAVRLVIELASPDGSNRRRGTSALSLTSLSDPGADLDVEASLDAIIGARVAGRPPEPDELLGRAWSRCEPSIALVIDRSGSMTGERLSLAALTAAATVSHRPTDVSAIAFSSRVSILHSQGPVEDPEPLIDRVLQMTGRGTTDLALALRVARRQLDRSGGSDRRIVLLSDCRWNTGSDPLAELGDEHLSVLCPADDALDAERFSRSSGARLEPIETLDHLPAAIERSLTLGA